MTDMTDPSYFKARDVEEWKASRRDAPEDIAEAKKLLTDEASYARMAEARSPYGDGKAAGRIVDAILYRYGKSETPPEEFK